MERVILFEGAYATLDLFTEEIRKELERRSVEVMVFQVNEYQASLMKMAQFLQKPVTAAVAYNNLGFNMELVPGKNIWDDLGIPFVNILVDHPFHYKNALDAAPKKAIVLCIDKMHVNYIKRFWPEVKNVYFMPHGTTEFEKGKEWSEREIDVLYAGGLSVDLLEGLKPDKEKYQDFDAEGLVNYAVERLVCEHQLTTEEVVEQYLKENHVQYDTARLSQIITDFRIVDSYAVSYYREKVIETLVQNGVKVTVFGRGWDKRKCISNPNLLFKGYVTPAEILELMKNAKIVLNTMTWFKDGSHVRVFNGMMAGAVCFTDYSKYISEVITNGKNGYVFELDNLEKLVCDVKTVLNGDVDCNQIAENGRAEAVCNHTFKNRVDFILDLLV